MILTKPQAEAVYSAMCALNNVGGAARKVQLDRIAIIDTDKDGAMHVYGPESDERYADQAAFVAAYGLE